MHGCVGRVGYSNIALYPTNQNNSNGLYVEHGRINVIRTILWSMFLVDLNFQARPNIFKPGRSRKQLKILLLHVERLFEYNFGNEFK